MKEKIGIIGQGFVGSAVREGMKEHFDVLCFDKDPEKFSNVRSIAGIVEETEVTFLCVPTPMDNTGKCNTSILEAALQEIQNEAASYDAEEYVVVMKSTIPPGTTKRLSKMFPHLRLVFNPEFLTEANAVNDFINQDRIVLGGEDSDALLLVSYLYHIAFPDVPVFVTSSPVAELSKYIINTFLALKVSYANEIQEFCRAAGISYDDAVNHAKLDSRLGQSHWQVPGPDGHFGFGLSCFPKDLNALIHNCEQLGVDATMLKATWAKNLLVRPERDWEQLKGRAVID